MRIFIYINNAMINLQFLSRSRTWNHMFACETRLKHVDALLFVLERSRLCNRLYDEEIVIKIYSEISWGSELECHCLLRFEFPGNFFTNLHFHNLTPTCTPMCNCMQLFTCQWNFPLFRPDYGIYYSQFNSRRLFRNLKIAFWWFINAFIAEFFVLFGQFWKMFRFLF